jgi:elongator complex protein 3
MRQIIIEKIIERLISDPSIVSKEEFHKLKNDVYKDFKIPKWIPDIELLERYRELVISWDASEDVRILKLLRKRAIRSLSWVSVVSILTKPWQCPGKCIYCPNFADLPKSYIPNEPAVMRAELNAFDPIKQVHNRLRSLDITGHKIQKCDVRIIGWTWSIYPEDYRGEYIKKIYDAHTYYEDIRTHIITSAMGNEKFASFKIDADYIMPSSKDLEEAKKANETSASRVIWVAVETRPDYVNEKEIRLLRKYWITRVEIWYQTTIDEINILNKRWHTNKESIYATRLLKDAWFKVVAHMMPNLLWSNPEMDIESLKKVFEDPDFRPDELKIYPMVVTANSELTEIWKKWGFTAYDDETLIELMARMQAIIPEYVRLNRMYRDIPASEILAWSHLANLRQIVDEKMSGLWLQKKDISSREIRLKINNPTNAILDELEYDASLWKEYYLQFLDPIDRTLFSHLRLRIPSQVFTAEKHHILELQDAAIIREVHTYWDQLSIWAKWDWSWQHQWFGKKLLARAEDIIKTNYPQIKKIAVISWVWVRGYYEKNWYTLEGEYMIKYI